MIEIVKEILRKNGFLKSGEDIQYSVSIGKSTNVQVFLSPYRHLNLKISKDSSLEKEFSTLLKVYSEIPEFVPEPISLEKFGTLEIILSDGVLHKNISIYDFIFQRKRMAATFSRISQSFKENFSAPASPNTHMMRIRNAANNLRHLEVFEPLDKWVDQMDREMLNDLPHIQQHGDFTPNNIGVHKKSLTIFDWEEFGQITLPGYDIFILSFILFGFNLEKMISVTNTGNHRYIKTFLETSLKNSYLTFDTFKKLYIAYLILFLDSKINHGYSLQAQKGWEKFLSEALKIKELS